MLNLLRPAVTLTLFFTLLTGVAYPFVVTGIAQGAFSEAANGSLVIGGDPEGGSSVIGSALIAQPFTGAGYLHPRPSASGWNAAGTGASNLGPTSAKLVAEVAARRAEWQAANAGPAPIDAVTTSASGLDPDISPETALAEVPRIAAARRADPDAVRALIARHVKGRVLGLYGEPTVNVLITNLALDAAFPMAPAGAEESKTE